MGSASKSLEALVAEISALRRENAALEQKLEASEAARWECDERFRDLAENIQEVFWIDTPDLTKTLYVSPAYEEIWGRSCQSLYKNPRSFIDAIHPHDRDRITTRTQSQGWEGFFEEYRIIRPNGEIRWIRDRAWPIRDESGKTIRVAGIAQDISSHKAAEASLRNYEQMVSTTPDLMAFVDKNYRYQVVNKRYAEVFGKPRELIAGMLVSDILGLAKFDELKPSLDECLSGKPVNYQHWIDTPKEGMRYFDVHYQPAVDSDGAVFGIVADVRDLTDLKQAEKKMKESQIFMTSIVDNIPYMIFVKDAKDLRFLSFNKAGEELVGYHREAMIGKTDYDFFPKSEADFFTTKDREVLAGKTLLDISEEVIQSKSLGTRYLHTKKIPILDDQGTPQYLLGISQDITEWKETEERLRKGERKFRAIYEQAPTGIAILDSLSGRFIQINRKYCDITGYSQEEMLDRTFQEVTHPDDLQADLENMQQLLSGQISSFKMEKRYLRKSGEVIWVNLTCVPLWLESTDPRQHMAMVEEITYRKKAEKALQESEERFRLLNEAIPQQVWSAQPDGSIDYVNQRVLQYFDCSFEDILDQGWQRFLHPDDLPGCLERWGKALETQQPYEIEFRLLGGKDHSFRWHLGRALPILDQDGQVVKWFGTNTDITQFKQLETQIRQSQKMEAMGTLAGGIAHDFNNILMAITGYAELATFNSRGNNAAQRNLQEVLVAGQRAKELVQQILAFSRQTEHERQPIELKSVVKEVCKLLRASLPATVEIRQNFTKLPTLILGDPIQIHQVVMNLCANAEHAMRESGGLLELKVEHVTGEPDGRGISSDLTTGGSYIRLTVRDNGAGMTQDVAERIFDPFFTTKAVGEGTGMGLAVVHGIIASHGGDIHVRSEPGQGTTFTIDFPEMEARSLQGGKKALEQEYRMGHGRILFVEDEEALARLGKEAMTGLGYEVMMRTSSVEALEAFRADPLRFDVVVTDQTMPNMTGEALSRELLQIRPGVPIILCTGFSHNMTLEKAKAIGIRAFLLKPLLIKDLAQTLYEVLHA
jgi:PAS domain S-box-containing protein